MKLSKSKLHKELTNHPQGYIGTIVQKNEVSGRGNILTHLEKDGDQIKTKSPQDRDYTWFTIPQAVGAFANKNIREDLF